jgi:RND family efflux transporter MFP subunit
MHAHLTSFHDFALLVTPILLESTLKGTLALGLASVAVLSLRHASAAMRHLIWMVGIAMTLALPLLSAVLPKWHALPRADLFSRAATEPLSAAEARPMQATPQAPISQGVESKTPIQALALEPARAIKQPSKAPDREIWFRDLGLAVFAIWLVGAGILALSLIAGHSVLLVRASRAQVVREEVVLDALREAAARLAFHGRVRLLLDTRYGIPLAWGVIRPCLLLPADAPRWDRARLNAVLLHELAHLQRYDLLALLLTRVACTLYWFNPLVWLAVWRLQIEREGACDDLVLGAGLKASDYAEHLLQATLQYEANRSADALAMATPSRLERRLSCLLNPNRTRASVTPTVVLSLAAASLVVAVPLAMIQATRGADPVPESAKGQGTRVSSSNGRTGTSASAQISSHSTGSKVIWAGVGSIVPEQLIEVNAKVSSQVVRLLAQVGAAVKAGDVLAELDPEPIQQEVERLHAKVEVARAHLAQAKTLLDSKSASYQRVAALKANGTISDTEVTEAKSTLQLAQVGVAEAESELKLAEVDLQSGEYSLANTQIRAPLEGVILHTYAEVGAFVDPKAAGGHGARLYDMADLRQLAIQFEVADGTSVVPGQFCSIMASDRGGGTRNAFQEVCQAQVVSVGGAVNPDTGTFPVRAKLGPRTNGQVLRPGSLLRVNLLGSE